jgi:hypothetical protein
MQFGRKIPMFHRNLVQPSKVRGISSGWRNCMDIGGGGDKNWSSVLANRNKENSATILEQ